MSVSRIVQPIIQLAPAAGPVIDAAISALSGERIRSNTAIKYPPACLNQFSEVSVIEFPIYSGLQCNMMPFKMGDKNSLPKEYQHYWHLIDACKIPVEELEKVGYLTISESFVEENSTQRRPGVHVEKHPTSGWGGGGWGGGKDKDSGLVEKHPTSGWGGGSWGGGKDKGSGLYMASNIDKTCRVWDCYVEVPGPMGDCAHLKNQLNTPIDLKANQLVWMTDSCPHEAIPQKESGKRQYFRLVTSHVALWYKAHSTPNPLVSLPEHVKVIEGNKFSLPPVVQGKH